MNKPVTKRKVTTTALAEMKAQGRKISMLTCYDAGTAKILNEAEIDVLLVGDSLGNVVLGYENTIPVTVDEMLHHTKAVKRGNSRALLVTDMPFMSYEVDPKEAVRNAGRLVKDGGAEAVKIEGGMEVAGTVKALVAANIPVMCHIGLMPQSIHKLGGYKVQGKTDASRDKLATDAKVLEGAGAFAVVLECVDPETARVITGKLKIPTIGIGAGPHCDGQVLVINDMLGLNTEFSPKFVKRYANLRQEILKAAQEYRIEIGAGKFPGKKHCY